MNDHLAHEILVGFAERTLAPEELLTASDHFAGCAACRQELSVLSAQSAKVSSMIDSFRSEAFPDHVEFNTVTAYVDGTLDEVAAEIVGIHLEDCPGCADEVQELRQLSAGSQATPIRAAVIDHIPSFADQVRAFFGAGALRFAVPLVVLISIAAIVVFLTRSLTEDRTHIAANTEQPNVNTDVVAPIVPANTDNTAPPATMPERAATTLSDGDREIRFGADGKLIEPFAGEYDQRIEAAIRTGSLTVADEARRLRAGPGVLMGPNAGTSGLRVRSPIGKVVATANPEFRWSQVDGAESYSVEIYDSNYNKVASSTALKGGSWRVNPSLVPGREYSWQVTAVRNGETLRAPVRPAPDAKFYVLSREKLNEIARARNRHGNSHLVLGLVYAEAGLIDDAERELNALARKNPDSAAVKRLLEKVRAAR